MSLRQAAREIGTSPNGLRNFLNGAAPRMITRGKLEQWLAKRTTSSRPPAVGQLVRLMNEIAADFSPQQVVALGRNISSLLEAAYEERRLSPPKWVREFARVPIKTSSESESVA